MSKSTLCIGSGLISGKTNEVNEFTVYTERGGIHGLSVSIDGPSKAEIRTFDKDASVKVQYVPTVAGDYRITVKYDGISVKGSPFNLHVRGGQNVLTQNSPFGKVNTEPVDSFDKKFQEADADYDRKASRSLCSRVKVSGRGLYSGICNISNEINVDVKDAGQGRLHWSVEGPGHIESKNRGLSDGVYRLYYKTDTAGEYRLNIRWDDQDVIGSPFHIRVI